MMLVKETIWANGDSTWLKAIRVQENPPNGNLALTSSIKRITKAKEPKLDVNRATIPTGIARIPCRIDKAIHGRTPTKVLLHERMIRLELNAKMKLWISGKRNFRKRNTCKAIAKGARNQIPTGLKLSE